MENKYTPEEARELLWGAGELSWKLEYPQKKIYDFIQDRKNQKVTVVNCSRRIGKTFVSCLIASQECVKNPKTIVKFIAPEAKMIRSIISPILDEIFDDAPDHLIPKFNRIDSKYEFRHNGSEIQLAGADNQNYQNLRGGNSHICIVDEAGFISDLKPAVKSVLLPTTITTKGRILIISTPPEQGDHDFVEYMDKAALKDNLFVMTIKDYIAAFKEINEEPTRITQDELDTMIDEYGGENSIEFRRELMCEVLTSVDSAVCPEFTKQVEDDIVQHIEELPPYFDCYTGLDIGGRDNTAALLAYYDYLNNRVVVRKEVIIPGPEMTTKRLAEEIRAAEDSTWFDKKSESIREPSMRISDNNNLILLNDLNLQYGIHFLPTIKDDKRAAVNLLRQKIAAKEIIIDPSCKQLLHELRTGSWEANGKNFKRKNGSHLDCVDALIYMIRAINYQKNPYPANYEMVGQKNVFYGPKNFRRNESFKETIRELLKPKTFLKKD